MKISEESSNEFMPPMEASWTFNKTPVVIFGGMFLLGGILILLIAITNAFLGKFYSEWGSAEVVNGRKVFYEMKVPTIFNLAIGGMLSYASFSFLNFILARVSIETCAIYYKDYLKNRAYKFQSLKAVKFHRFSRDSSFSLYFTDGKVALDSSTHGFGFCQAVLKKVKLDRPDVELNKQLKSIYQID